MQSNVYLASPTENIDWLNISSSSEVVNDFFLKKSLNAAISPLFSMNIFNLNASAISSNVQDEVDLTELIDYRYELLKPIKVIISQESLDYIGRIPELKIYAFGESYFEVLREINKDITELFEELLNIDDDMLGKDPTNWKEFLLQYVVKIND